MNRRLYRSRTDSVIGGVAGGVAEYLDVDPSIVRIVWAILAIVTGGIFLVLYIVMWIVVPEGAQGSAVPYQPGPGAMPGWTPPETGQAAQPAGSAMPPVAPAAATEGETMTSQTEPGAPAPVTDETEPVSTEPVSTEPVSTEPPAGWTAYPPPAEAHPRRRGSGGAMIFGLVLILLGAWFLIDEYLPGIDSDLLWPIALVVIGAALLFVAMRRSSET